ncbi:MAG TPA: hypothetical protein VKK81_04475 [Candidatus Binatia bacterium]|nr:hypothetical protein [Candidatus Binatia bacterium]
MNKSLVALGDVLMQDLTLFPLPAKLLRTKVLTIDFRTRQVVITDPVLRENDVGR